tara:strand:- start:506 stop:730 length:225 start_codon:yes stop_codon:yes gene_type:complete
MLAAEAVEAIQAGPMGEEVRVALAAAETENLPMAESEILEQQTQVAAEAAVNMMVLAAAADQVSLSSDTQFKGE